MGVRYNIWWYTDCDGGSTWVVIGVLACIPRVNLQLLVGGRGIDSCHKDAIKCAL